jgi:hypothetical protein
MEGTSIKERWGTPAPSRARGRTAALVTLAAALAATTGGCYIVSDQSQPAPVPWPPGTPVYDGGVLSGSVDGRTDPGGGTGGVPGADAGLPRSDGGGIACPGPTVARFKELLLVDPTVLADSRADNAAIDHPWSFRQRLEDLAGGTDAAGALADAWLAQWNALTAVPASTDPGAATIPVTPRPAADSVLRCPWLQSSSTAAGCNADCSSCRSHVVDLSVAPFRLVAIANRLDLGTAGACGTDGGELRFVYGAAQPGSGMALPFTLIFEYHVTLRTGETLRDWAATWHQLAASVPGPTFNARLAGVVAQGLARASLRRMLTNENAFGAVDGLPWEMRQFVPTLTDDGVVRLVEVAVAQTPRLTLGPSASLGQWIDQNAASVLAGDNKLDARFLAASAPIPTPDFAWQTMATDPAVNAAFNKNTCNGCHGGRSEGDLPFQHIAPPAGVYYGPSNEPVRLSRFLNNPGYDDELGRRERVMAGDLCAVCSGGTGGTGVPY